MERVDKHPFCMSRVYYDRTECPDEVWAEDADQTYRWRQTSSEVKIIALKVHKRLAARKGFFIHPIALDSRIEEPDRRRGVGSQSPSSMAL